MARFPTPKGVRWGGKKRKQVENGLAMIEDFDIYHNSVVHQREPMPWEYPPHKHFYRLKDVEWFFTTKILRFRCEVCGVHNERTVTQLWEPRLLVDGRWWTIDELLPHAMIKGGNGKWRSMSREELVIEVTRTQATSIQGN